MIERSDLLDSDLLAGGLVNGRAGGVLEFDTLRKSHETRENIPDNTIGALTNNILNIILLAHVERDLAGPRSVRGVRSRHGRGEEEGKAEED